MVHPLPPHSSPTNPISSSSSLLDADNPWRKTGYTAASDLTSHNCKDSIWARGSSSCTQGEHVLRSLVVISREAERPSRIKSNTSHNHRIDDIVLPSCHVTSLKACATMKNLRKGREEHAEIVKKGLLDNNVLIGSSLVSMYGKCGALAEARDVFDDTATRDVVIWNALISSYSQLGHGEDALKCFERMLLDGFPPNAVTFVCILKACGSTGALGKGQEIHLEIARLGLLHNNIVVATALVDMYCKCGALAKAQEVFEDLPTRDVVIWTALISGYAQHGHGEKALNCFQQMRHEGIRPNASTFVCTLKACGSVKAVNKGEEIHELIVKEGVLRNNILVANALVDMYAKCGLLKKAQEVFNDLPVHDVFLWTALITGYVQHGYDEEALKCFELMQRKGLSPDAATFVCILKSCGSMGALGKGKEIHAQIVKDGFLEQNIIMGTALVDMYAKCGDHIKAEELFKILSIRNVVSWTALIAGYALLGKDDVVFRCYMKMVKEGITPNLVTFSSFLNVCSHSGLLEEAEIQFDAMFTNFGIVPNLEHYTCMIDLYGRAGHLHKAAAMIESMPSIADKKVFHTLLAACQRWGNVKLGKILYEQAMRLDDKDVVTYISMSNIYAAAGLRAEADIIDLLSIES